jgi:bacterioferritin-associated ferredoxin
MQPDDELCLCFHVSWRKVINYIRIHRVRLPSQLAACQSAGTGCGWCRAAMIKLVDRMEKAPPDADDIERWLSEEYSSREAYAAGRKEHLRNKNG